MKKILYVLTSVFIASSMFSIFNQTSAHAAGCNSTFFGIPSWCRGLGDGGDGIKPISKDPTAIQKFVWTIVGNVSDGIFRIIGVIAVGFIIWAGYQYMLAAGDVGKIANAKKTLTNAIVGLVIAVMASVIVQFVLGVF